MRYIVHMPDKKTVIEIRTDTVEERIDSQLGERFPWHKYQILVGRNSEPNISLDDINNLSDTQGIEMRINIENILYDIELPSEMMARLTRYLANKDYPFTNGEFDCVSFVHAMIGEPYKFHEGVNLDKFEMERLETDWNIKPGDIIHFSPADKWGQGMSATHAAVYIGHGLYLSKFGEKAGIGVQKLYQIQELYGRMGENNLFRQVAKGGDH